MQCGRESMCAPCWNSSPEEQGVICQAVYDLQKFVRGDVLDLPQVQEVLDVRATQYRVDNTPDLLVAVRRRLEEESVEVWPLDRILTQAEIEE